MTDDSNRKEKGDFDWGTIEERFVLGTMPLKWLSFEHTGNAADPAYITLQGHSKSGNWKEKRKNPTAYAPGAPSHSAPVAPYSGGVTPAEFTESLDAVKQACDMLKMSRNLRELFEVVQPNLKTALETVEIANLRITNPIAFVGFLNAMSNMLEVSAKLERAAMGTLNVDAAIQVVLAYGYDVVDKRNTQDKNSKIVPLRTA